MAKVEHIILLIIAFAIKLLSKNKLLILNYHRVQDKDSLFFESDIDQHSFAWQMHLISRYLTPTGLTHALQKLKHNQLPGSSIVVTFDDGYKDNVSAALPILQNNKVPATFFIATGFLNDGMMWNDVLIESIKLTQQGNINLIHLGMADYPLHSKAEKLYAIEKIVQFVKYKNLTEREHLVTKINKICSVVLHKDLMMNDDDIIQLFQSGMEIGGHTVNHPILSSETNDIIKREIAEGKVYLETLLKTPLTLFAYPNGKSNKDYETKHVKMLRESGFDFALTTNWGFNSKNTEPLELNRFTPWDNSRITFLLRIFKLYLLGKV